MKYENVKFNQIPVLPQRKTKKVSALLEPSLYSAFRKKADRVTTSVILHDLVQEWVSK